MDTHQSHATQIEGEAGRRSRRQRVGILVALGLAIVGLAVFGWVLIPPAMQEDGRTLSATADPAVIAQGRYIAALGDCVACHTKDGGQPMAGGQPLTTPFGVLYSTNITPDPRTGIGTYTFGAFDRAMRKGVGADGRRLYPAMPYPSYARMTADDMYALYAFLMQGQAPVAQANLPTQMSFPFNLRWGLAFWNTVFLDTTRFVANPAKDAVWNRGAYLVEGLGHCGACHTPRGIGFQEVAISDAGPNGGSFLAGAKVEEWNAINLRDLWTVADTADLLKTGQNRFATVSGSMTEVVHHSTQAFTDPDLIAVATYLKSLPSDRLAAWPTTLATPDALFTTRGGLAYTQFCSDCHRTDGSGVAKIFPALARNPTVAANDPATLIHLMLTGWKTAETQTQPRVYTMPGFANLSNQEIAEIVSFVRTSWGSGAAPVTAAQIADARAKLGPTAEPTVFDTPRMADMLSEPNATELVYGMRLHVQTKSLLPDNVGNVLNCTSCHLNGGTVAGGSPFVGVSAFFPSYAPRAGRVISLEERINGCFLRSMNGKALAVDSPEMKAMVAYFDWMKRETKPGDKVPGRGVGTIDASLKPDAENGAHVYAAQCAVCHGANGEGLRAADGHMVYPPLWGPESFNIGAGMARTRTAAAFVKRNMPVGFHERFPLGQGGLSDQESIDVGAFFTHQPRPDFAAKVNDWPKDPKPGDARY